LNARAGYRLLGFDDGSEYFTEKMGTPEYYNWMGYAFEAICYKHIPQIRNALKIRNGSLAGIWLTYVK